MATDENELIDLAGAILDDAEVVWPTDGSESSIDPELVAQLRVVAQLVRLHHDLPVGQETPGLPLLDEGAATDLRSWGHLRLQERVGRGSFGDVYRAWDTRLDREVALKVIEAGSAAQRASLAIDEGRLLARVRHPNVVTVYGAEQIGSQIGIWTEFVHGETLEDILRRTGPLPAAEVVAYAVEVCAALDAVHRAGLLHRDIKAQNVMREVTGRIVLMDFGAGIEPIIEGRSKDVSLAGTPLYVAPEILEGDRPTAQSDIYSVGVLLFHLLTGSFPVLGASLDDVRTAHRRNGRVALNAVRWDVPHGLDALVERAIDPNPTRRFADAAHVQNALRTVLPGSASQGSTSRPLRVRTAWLITAAAGMLIATVVVGQKLLTQTSGASRNGSRPDAIGFAASTGLQMRKVVSPQMGLFKAGTPSFDGRRYSNTDLNQDLTVFDLQTGGTFRVTDRGDSPEMASFSVLSADGQLVAYAWTTADDGFELRVSDIKGKHAVVLVPRRAEAVTPVEWSRDGTQVLCLLSERDGSVRVALVDTANGAVRLLPALKTAPGHVTLSADNRFVAYDAPVPGSPAQWDIFVQPVDGSPPTSVVSHPANDVNPAWTPDGHHLFFVSDRSGTLDGWIVGVVDGVAEGDPLMVARNVGSISLAGFTSSGALYYWRQSGDMDVFTQPLDGAGTRAKRIPSRLSGSNSGPAWSPEGRALAYVSHRTDGTTALPVVVIHPESGNDREIPLLPSALKRVAPVPLRWSPDGDELLVRGADLAGNDGVFILGLDDGHLSPGVLVSEAHASDVSRARWWTDGRSIAYVSPKGIIVRERGSGIERLVFDPRAEHPPLRLASFELSPDGRSLAIAGVIENSDPPTRELLVKAIGGTAFQVARATAPDQLFLQDWMPSGRELLITRRNMRLSGPHALWRVSLDGVARDTGIRIPGFTQVNTIQVDPSGQRIAYTADQPNWDLWVMEHFLPENAR